MSWLLFIACIFWGFVTVACVRLVTGSVSNKRCLLELGKLRAELDMQRIPERVTDLESASTNVRNRLETLKGTALGRKWGS